MKRRFGIIFLIIFLLSACSAATTDRTNPTPTIPASAPKFINHQKPDISLDITAFDKARCPTDQYGFRRCLQDSPLYAFGCDEIKEPSSLLGALKPAYPIMLCMTDHWSLIDERKNVDALLSSKCKTSPREVCTHTKEIAGQGCERTHSGFCENYRQALIKKCNDPSANVCDPLDGIMAILDEANDKTFGHVEHLSNGYTYRPDGAYFFRDGGLAMFFYRYVIRKDNQFVLIENEDEFRQIFAPLESPEEALAYVKAATGHIELYDLKYDSDAEYFVDTIEDTHAEKAADGYVVNLFIENLECSTATTEVKFHVTSDGHITEQGLLRVFKKLTHGMCTKE